MALTYKITKPSALKAVVALPASKSISNRALILNALAQGETNQLANISDCDDTNVMLKALTFKSNDINIGAAGTSMRFLTAFLSATPGTWSITGSERMKQRPIKILVEALRKIGADIEYIGNEGFPPLKINGKDLGRRRDRTGRQRVVAIHFRAADDCAKTEERPLPQANRRSDFKALYQNDIEHDEGLRH